LVLRIGSRALFVGLIAVQQLLHRMDEVKQLMLDSVSSPITKMVYNTALDEFIACFKQAPQAGPFL
jgi:hypothetical protein